MLPAWQKNGLCRSNKHLTVVLYGLLFRKRRWLSSSYRRQSKISAGSSNVTVMHSLTCCVLTTCLEWQIKGLIGKARQWGLTVQAAKECGKDACNPSLSYYCVISCVALSYMELLCRKKLHTHTNTHTPTCSGIQDFSYSWILEYPLKIGQH